MKARFAFILLLLCAFSLAQTSLNVPAVDTNGKGVLTLIEARIESGSGEIFVDIEPYISVDTQQSAKTAAAVAAKEARADLGKFDFFLKVVANTEIVDGPSGGAALALLIYSELLGVKPRSDMAVTGTIERDGSVGPIGGVWEKARALDGTRVKLFLIPKGQNLNQGRNVAAEAAAFGVQVVEVRNLQDVIRYAFTREGTAVTPLVFQEQPLELPGLPSSAFSDSALKRMAVEDLRDFKQEVLDLGDSEAAKIVAQNALVSINLTERLIGEGYYYSAANTLYVAKISVESFKLKDVKETDFLQLVKQLQDEVDELKLGFTQPTEHNFEWVIGAKLRYYWALDKIDGIKQTAGIANVGSLLPEYISAKNWISASRQMNGAAKEITASVQASSAILSEGGAKEQARSLLDALNRSQASVLDSEIGQHYYAGERAYSEGEYATAFTDAIFAKAFYDANKKVSSKIGSDDFKRGLLTSPSELSSFNTSIWAQFYYIHSLYLISEANRTNEFVYTENAFKLQELSKAFAEEIPFLKGLMLQQIPQSSEGGIKIKTTVTQDQSPVSFYWIVLLVALVLVAFAFLSRSAPKSLQDVKSLSTIEKIEKLDELLMHGKISEESWETLHERYFKKLKAEEKLSKASSRKKR